MLGLLFRLLTEEGDEVVPVLGLLQATKGHLRARNVLLRVLKIFELLPRVSSLLLGDESRFVSA